MTIQLSDDIRDAQLDIIETILGVSAILRIRTGAKPANCAASDTGTILAEMTLPSDWMAASSGGVKVKSGTWEDISADNPGVAGHFRLYTSGGVCKFQGTITATGGGGDMEIQNTTLAVGQDVIVTLFTLSNNVNQ